MAWWLFAGSELTQGVGLSSLRPEWVENAASRILDPHERVAAKEAFTEAGAAEKGPGDGGPELEMEERRDDAIVRGLRFYG